MSIKVNAVSEKEKADEKYLFSNSLGFISDQLRRIEQKLTTRTDNKIDQTFHMHAEAAVTCEKMLNNIKNPAFLP